MKVILIIVHNSVICSYYMRLSPSNYPYKVNKAFLYTFSYILFMRTNANKYKQALLNFT